MKKVETILREAIERYDADGLCHDECGCDRSNLFPCGEAPLDCVLAKKRKPTEEEIIQWDMRDGEYIYIPLE